MVEYRLGSQRKQRNSGKGMMFFVLQLLIACRIYPKIESYQDQKLEEAAMKSVVLEHESGQLHYWEGGNLDGEPLLFLHGFGGDAAWAWARNFPDFSEEYHIIAPDLLWFGGSEDQKEPSLNVQVEAIKLLMEERNIPSSHVIGLSYGGFVGIELSKRYPVDSLILVGVGGWKFSEDDISAIADRFQVDNLEDIFVPKKKEDIRTLLDICFYTPTYLVPKQLSDDLYGTVFGKYPEEQALLLRELLGNHVGYSQKEDTLQASRTLLIIGKTDPLFSVVQATELSAALYGELLIYGKADHVPNVGYRRKFSRDVNDFLKKIEGTAESLEKEEE